jgi:UDP-N-acetyl-2-amino-2-deoxyglucuronate dehydrogenase
MAGYLELERANVRWFLSVDREDLPDAVKAELRSTFRSIAVDGGEVEFSGGFTDLHTLSYKEVLAGNGFDLEKARDSMTLVHRLRHSTPVDETGDRQHPFVKR